MLFMWPEWIIDLQEDNEGPQDHITILKWSFQDRDYLRIAVEEERLLRENDDEEIRKKLKVSSFSLCLTEAG